MYTLTTDAGTQEFEEYGDARQAALELPRDTTLEISDPSGRVICFRPAAGHPFMGFAVPRGVVCG